MMLYDAVYYVLGTGRRLNCFDSDVPLSAVEPGKGEVACCTCTNWDRHTVWIGHGGDEIEPPWFTRETVEQRAAKEAKRLLGEKATVQRVTGSPRMSGYFQAYLPCQGSGLSNYTSVGKVFHVASEDD